VNALILGLLGMGMWFLLHPLLSKEPETDHEMAGAGVRILGGLCLVGAGTAVFALTVLFGR
jgi:hypothetical protein